MIFYIFIMLLQNINGQYFPPGYSGRRIVGGTEAKIIDWPFIVAIYEGEEQIGGGSLISPKCVVTAAHVCTDFDSSGEWTPMQRHKLTMQLGSTALNDGYIVRKAQDILVHPKFNPKDTFHDVAIIILDENVLFRENQRAVKLAIETPDGGTLCKTAGWGETLQKYSDGTPTSNQSIRQPRQNHLLEVPLPLIRTDKCRRLMRERMKHRASRLVSKNVICTLVPQGGKDACQGDSGGPLICNDQLSGITSWGDGCALPNVPGIFTDVAKYRRWIQDTCQQERVMPSNKITKTFKSSVIFINIISYYALLLVM